MKSIGLLSILITAAIALWWFTGINKVLTPAGETGDPKQSYNDMIESARDAAGSISR